jgi:hypothetical protein
MRAEFVLRFWSKVQKSDDCWIWTGSKTGEGYGSLRVGARTVGTHRFSWVIENGSIPKGLSVLHRCDNPSCVRPSHLFLGTQKDNMQDCMAKGRGNKARGMKHGKAKLTPEMVLAMRAVRNEGLSYAQIGKRFGVWPGTAYNAINGKKMASHLKHI